MQKLRLDRRLIDRKGWISQPELDSELEGLPDSGHKATTLGAAEDATKSEPLPPAESSFPSE